MIKSVLVANRGEIAVRIVRTCREMGIKSIAIYSEADRGALHTRLADQAICVGPPTPSQSYLNTSNIIAAACSLQCDAIHPGVGFLAENSAFAQAVEAAGLKFIGPEPQTIALLGDKVESRQWASKLKIPLPVGSLEGTDSLEKALQQARKLEFPLMLKAKAGGGGRGIRIVNSYQELIKAFPEASQEALNAFGDGQLFLETYITNPKHIEVQLLADQLGGVVVLGERDCSLQKNHQKVIEEGPASNLSPTVREKLFDDSKRLFSHIGYQGAGTVEFLVKGEEYWFLEVNARLQVEHTITEMVTMCDLVKYQFLIASGRRLPPQEEFHPRGHALECRLNATSVGQVTHFNPPLGGNVRVDTLLYPGVTIAPHYDPLIAKIVTHTPQRSTTIAAMRRALHEIEVGGIETNKGELLALLESPSFLKGEYGTTHYSELFSEVNNA